MNGFSGKFSTEELQGFKDSWEKEHKQFIPQDVDKEFGTPDRSEKPEMTFREIAESEGIDVSMVHRVFKRAMGKVKTNLAVSGINKEIAKPDSERIYLFKGHDGVFRSHVFLY